MSANLFLIGFMGAGKSTVAAKLNQMTGKKLIEMDETIVSNQGMSINEIFEKYGETRFREIESELVKTISSEGDCIVSCGGGVVIKPENVEEMKKNGKIVFLSATPETIFERVRYSTDRPILNGHMNVEYIAGLMEKRRALYEAAADVMIATDNKDADEICNEILALIG
ncbi:MAG: shikimate kinase [Lachnospiraceae bacterium]|nr:shikimate kinase [Lachnospiraceae bacterium]